MYKFRREYDTIISKAVIFFMFVSVFVADFGNYYVYIRKVV